MCEDSIVMGWLWHSMEPHIATTVEFCDSSKKIWNSLSESFSHQSNVSQVYDLYEQIFATKQSGRTLSEYYGTLKNLWEQLLQHRPFTADLEQQKRHWEEFTIATLLRGLDQELKGFKDQILASESLPTAANAYSRLLRSSLGQSSTPSPNLRESSAFVSSSAGRGGFRGGRSTRGVRGGRTGGRGDRKCDHCGGTNHTEPYCWIKWGKPEYVHQVSDAQQPTQPPISSRHVPSNSDTRDALTTQLSELVQTLKNVAPHSSSSIATLVNSGNVACVAHSSPSWVIDSRASSHISVTNSGMCSTPTAWPCVPTINAKHAVKYPVPTTDDQVRVQKLQN
ncbi:hypothetical protein IFM89_033790 [Coptis chinensis]|uniref:Retrotransposon gag domain-containing protein n=1 Tax=Coptis chinensis TaxID=261450 RepID=A0A835HLJ8_9MAGN|nr:hypothetical protein IFM89_033790 [Coptis chinensis]